jgi:hypothetical protein
MQKYVKKLQGESIKEKLRKVIRQEIKSINEAKEIKFHQIQPKDYIWYRGGIQYFVTKTGPNVLHMGLVNKGKPGSGGSLFASNTKLTRKNFDSQIRVKFIKKITRDKNTLWQESVNEANIIQKIDKLAKSNKYGTVDGTRMNGKTAKEIMAIFMHPKMNSYRRQMTGMKAHELVDLTISLLKPLKIKVESVDTVFKETLRKFIRQELVKEDWWSEMSPPAQDQYVKDHPDSEKAKSVKKSKEKGEKEKRELAKKIKSGEYELDSATGKAVKKKKGKEDPKKRNKHVAAIRKGYFPGTPEYEKFMKESVNEAVEPKGNMAKIFKIVKDKQHAKIGGMLVDTFSASALVKIFNAVKDSNKEKLNKMNIKKLAYVLNKAYKDKVVV